MKKVDNIQEQMSNLSRDRDKTLRKNNKEILEIKIIIIEMKSALDELIIDVI